jgi:hypothetical protein
MYFDISVFNSARALEEELDGKLGIENLWTNFFSRSIFEKS